MRYSSLFIGMKLLALSVPPSRIPQIDSVAFLVAAIALTRFDLRFSLLQTILPK